MLKNLSFLALASSFALTGCVLSIGDDVADDEVGTEDTTTTETGDTTETETTADTETTTDTAETEVGETAETETTDETADETDTGTMNMCGWDTRNGYYECGFEGEDPSGVIPLACPEGLTVGDPCGDVTGAGCCDANGDLWYCTDEGGTETLTTISCEA